MHGEMLVQVRNSGKSLWSCTCNAKPLELLFSRDRENVQDGFFDAKDAKKSEGSQRSEFPLRSLPCSSLRPSRQEQRFRHLDTPVKDREQLLSSSACIA